MEYFKVDYKSHPLFKGVSANDWNDWQWQIRNRIRTIEKLKKAFILTKKIEEDILKCLCHFRMAITPYYAALADREYSRCPIRLQAVPLINEIKEGSSDFTDPLFEDVDSPCKGLTHRYPDRVLLLVTKICSMYCRHCTRRRLVGVHDADLSLEDFEISLKYLEGHKEVRDIIVSGGDPMTMTDDKIEFVLKSLRKIKHIEIIRLGTRCPVVLPMRITEKLVKMIKKYHPVYINTQFNHPKEVTVEAKAACERLVDAGIPVGNQSVLLRDINDCPCIMKKLMHMLLSIRVKPYYIYQCDLTKGISHFRTSIVKGIEIIENLRGHTSGLAVPSFVVDSPGGGGKIPIMPNYTLSFSDRRIVLRNYEGMILTYTQPEKVVSDCGQCKICQDPKYKALDGIAKLLRGEKLYLEPKDLRRHHSNDIKEE